MTSNYVQVQPDGTGKKVDTSELAVGLNTVERQRVVLSDDAAAAGLAKVGNTQPGTSDYGLTARTIAQASSSGTVTTVNATTSSTLLLAANTARLGASIRNSPGSTGRMCPALYIKLGTGASSASHTEVLRAGDSYEVPARYTGEIDGAWEFAPAQGAQARATITELT